MLINQDLPKVERLDEQGTDENPSGWVYFADGIKLSYAPGISGMSNPFGLFPVKGPNRPTDAHYASAADHLMIHLLLKIDTDAN